MTSSRPYLIRALHQWIVDNGMTPYLLVNCTVAGVQVPAEHVSEGRVVLNVSPAAVQDLALGNDAIQFQARFGGRSVSVGLPPAAVLAIYARENGRGMVFNADGGGDEPSGGPDDDGGGKPQLRVVK